MEKRVKFFTNDIPSSLENQINSFLSETDGSLHDIKFFIDRDDYFVTLLVYTLKKEQHGKEKS